jgi:inhibitor of cysteine peptidase
MQQMRIMTLLAFAVLISVSACQAPPPTSEITANGRQVTVHMEQQLQVVLPSNPSTGFAWQSRTADRRILAQQGQSVYTPASKDDQRVGGGGVTTFTYAPVQPGRTTLVFEYRRPWLPDSQASDALTLHVDVLEATRQSRREPSTIIVRK